MKQEKLVKKPLPCSFFDIQGIQEWLDGMALQGLFLERLSGYSDRAFFKRGEPRPVRYRLDPMGENWNDVERKENYAQMGWEFVDAVPRTFYIFSCDDPEAPELHSDPASLSYALNTLIRRQRQDNMLLVLVPATLLAFILLANWNEFCVKLLLREHPFQPLVLLILAGLLLALAVYGVYQVVRLNNLRRTLDDGLPLKAGRRHWRPNLPYLAIFLPLMLLGNALSSLANNYSTVEFLDLDLDALSRPWPSLVQMETAPLPALRPEHYSYMTLNRSPAVPVQEHYTDRGAGFGKPFLKVWHYQASSPAAARRLYHLERKELEKDLQRYNTNPNSSESISRLTPFVPLERPGLDALETASYQYSSWDGWAFALRRGNDILLVRYAGSAPLEHGLDLLLDALGEEEVL